MSFDFLDNKYNKIHFIGIGGISMSGLAEILLERNYKVSGSDMKSSPITDKLEKMGAEIHIGQRAENISEDVSLVVYTAAISSDNPEFIRSQEMNIRMMDRAEFLGKVMNGHKYNIAIAGTHGKTTTTSMISHIALSAALDPTILVGGELDIIGGNVRTGKSEYFITEACEYKGSFLKFTPYMGIILNIDADHLDYYKDIEDIENAFLNFSNLIPENGYLVAYAEDARICNILRKVKCNTVTYGLECGDVRALDVFFNESGLPSYDLEFKGEKIAHVQLNVPGNHNVLNSLAAIASALILDIPVNRIIDGVESFRGTHRRFELKGHKNGVAVIDDYAHHPTEIMATLSAASKTKHNKTYCVFQPHTYTRTISLFDEFSKCFFDADELILADIYAAREKDTGIVSSQMLGDKIRELGINCLNFHSFEEIVSYLDGKLRDGDILLTVGAGDVFKVGEMYLEK